MEPQDNKQSTTTKIKQKIEQKVKNKILKIILTWLVTHIIPIILVLFIATLLLLIIQLNMNTVKDTFQSMKTTISQIFASEGNDEKSKQDNYSIKDELKAMIKISDDGLRFEQKSEFSKIMIQRLKDAQINTTQMYYTDEDYDPEEDANNLSDDELKNMIDKYIRAEVKTMFPKISDDDNGIDGIVKIRRTGYRAEDNSESYIDEELEYVPYSQLKAEASEIVEDDSIAAEYLKHFSLNPDTFELCLLIENRQYIWKEDEEHKGKPDTTVITFTMNEFDYQTALEPYATPVNFFVSLHQIVDDVDLMNELVDKVKNSTITLTYVEVPVITNSLWKYRGTLTTYKDTKTVTTVTFTKYEEITDEKGNVDKRIADTYNHTETTATTPQVEVQVDQLDTRKKCKVYLDEIGHKMNPAYTRDVSNSANLVVQEANTWISKTQKVIVQGNLRPLPAGAEEDDGPIKGEAKGWEYHQFIKKEPTQTPNTYYPKVPSEYEVTAITSEEYIYHTKKFSITGKNSQSRFSYTTNVVDKGGGIKTDEVIEFLNTYTRAKNNLLTSPSMFYYYLEQNENTQELEKDMKIIIEKITGVKQPEGRIDYIIDGENSGTGMDMKDLVGTDEYEDANEVQKKIVELARSCKIGGSKGMCLSWINTVANRAGAGVIRQGYARLAGNKYGVSKDFSYVPLGAAVYGLGGKNSVYGHCGIYIGNGLVAHCLGPTYANTTNGIRIESLSAWKSKYRATCWGWYSNVPVNSKYPITQGLMTGQKGVIK